MKIAIIGAGAIGGLVSGYLRLKNEDVTLIARKDTVGAIRENGLQISGVRGNFNIKIDAAEKLNYEPDLVILAVKTQDIDEALKTNLGFMQAAFILSTQNGVRAEGIIAKYLPKENIISSIVMFGATCLEPAKIVHNFEGAWVLGSRIDKINDALKQAFQVMLSDDIPGMKYLKIFVNANNCIPAIIGLSMQEAFSDINLSRISIAIWQEGMKIIKKAGINLASLPDFPLERLEKLTALPQDEAAKIYSGIMSHLSKQPLYGSILQSIKRGRPSEIDYINGEFVTLAKENNLQAPLNQKLVTMVHQVEATQRFFSKEELIRGLL